MTKVALLLVSAIGVICGVGVAGAAVGARMSSTASGGTAAPAWTLTDLGSLPGDGDAFVQPIALNDEGAVVAQLTWGVGSNLKQAAFLWRKGKRTRLGCRASPWVDVAAINGRGHVVGDVTLPSAAHSPVAALWRNGKVTLLGTLGGKESTPVAINAPDQVTGISSAPAPIGGPSSGRRERSATSVPSAGTTPSPPRSTTPGR